MNTLKNYMKKTKTSLFSRTFKNLVKRRERVLSGKINCIPWGLPRFEEENAGIEQGKFYSITASEKVGRFCPCS